jgi:hypothetical protein
MTGEPRAPADLGADLLGDTPGQPRRWPIVAVVVLAVALIGGVVAVAIAGGGSDDAGDRRRPTTTDFDPPTTERATTDPPTTEPPTTEPPTTEPPTSGPGGSQAGLASVFDLEGLDCSDMDTAEFSRLVLGTECFSSDPNIKLLFFEHDGQGPADNPLGVSEASPIEFLRAQAGPSAADCFEVYQSTWNGAVDAGLGILFVSFLHAPYGVVIFATDSAVTVEQLDNASWRFYAEAVAC